MLFVVLVTLLLAGYVSGVPARVCNHFAENEIAKRDFDSANVWLARTAWIAPNNALLHFLSARIARHEGDWASMSRHLRSASRLGADPDRIKLEELLSSAQSGRLNDVEFELSRRLAAGDMDAAEICDAYANGLAKESRFEEAVKILHAWNVDRPDDAVPYYRIGRIQEHLQKIEDAKLNYEQATTKDPNYYPAIYSLARVQLDENNVAEASRHFEKCLAMRNPLAAKTGLALCLIKLGEIECAITLLKEIQACDTALIHSSYASVNESIERNVAACELGKLYLNENQLDEALKMLDVAVRDNPRDLTARYSRALALKGLRREGESNADFELVAKTKAALERVNVLRNKINRENHDIDARIELGRLLIEFESERNGLFWLRSALQIDNSSSAVHRALAEYYEMHGGQSDEYVRLGKLHREQADKLDSQRSQQQAASTLPSPS